MRCYETWTQSGSCFLRPELGWSPASVHCARLREVAARVSCGLNT